MMSLSFLPRVDMDNESVQNKFTFTKTYFGHQVHDVDTFNVDSNQTKLWQGPGGFLLQQTEMCLLLGLFTNLQVI